MNIEDLVGKIVYVKRENDSYHSCVGGELQKDEKGYYVFSVDANGISSYIQFKRNDISREIGEFLSVYLK